VGRPRALAGLVAAASVSLLASALWGPTVAVAVDQPSDQTAAATESPAPEPSATPSPDLSPTPSPAPSPSLTPSPGDSGSTTPDSSPTESPADPSASPTISPTEPPSPSASPSASPTTQADDGSVDDYIVVVRNAAYIDSIKEKAQSIGGQTDKELRGAVDGFTAELTEQDVDELEADPNVRYIEADSIVSLTAATFRTVTKTTTSNLSSCDDCSSPSMSLGFTLDWFGTQYTNIFINTNGGAVLDDGRGSFRSYRNFDLRTATRPYILPLFTDLNPAANGTVEFGQGTISDGSPKNVFWAEWIDVAEYGNNSARQEFQMLIIEESDGATIEFRYVDLTNAGSTTNSVFEVGFADPTDSNNTVRIPDSNGDPSASELLSGKSGGSTGVWSYSVADSGSPSPAPTPTPTPTPINSIQPDPPWGLDRIDQRSLPLNSTFTPAGNGSGVTVYVIDTGIRTTHTEYASRVVAGYDFVDNDSDPSDCDGHGTHVAGTAVGSTYGVAKAASVSGVRVLNCYGYGYTSDVVAGMNWVRTNHSSGDAVVNMSLGGGGSKSIDDAVAALTSANITVVVAAGNSNDDAQYYSPARAATAITVGSTTSTDARSSFSNYGSTVDIFAPGSSILSAWYTSNTASNTLDGTSMASPHVAGAAAVYLGLNPGSTPTEVATALTSVSTTDAVTNSGNGSPDRLLYVADFSSGGGSAGGGGGGGAGGGGGGAGGGGGGAGGGGDSPVVEPEPAPKPIAAAPPPVPVDIPNPESVTGDQINAITPDQLAIIPPEVFGQLPSEALAGLTPEQASALTVAQVSTIKPKNARGLQPETIAALKPVHVAALRPASVARLQPAVIAVMSGEQVSALRPASVRRLVPAQLRRLAPSHVAALQPEQIRAMKPKQFRKLKPAAISALNPDHIQSLAKADLRELRLRHIRALTGEQLAKMAPRQLGSLKSKQARALTPQQLRELTTVQRRALGFRV
jgi:subtilisin family serine protease